MIGLDSNVLVRFFAQDDPIQSPKASRLMKSLTTTEPAWIPVATLLEVVWVMRSRFRLDHLEIAKLIGELLLRESIFVEDASKVEKALHRYRNGRADFADCFIAICCQGTGCIKTVTFDEIAARDAGMELIA